MRHRMRHLLLVLAAFLAAALLAFALRVVQLLTPTPAEADAIRRILVRQSGICELCDPPPGDLYGDGDGGTLRELTYEPMPGSRRGQYP